MGAAQANISMGKGFNPIHRVTFIANLILYDLP